MLDQNSKNKIEKIKNEIKLKIENIKEEIQLRKKQL